MAQSNGSFLAITNLMQALGRIGVGGVLWERVRQSSQALCPRLCNISIGALTPPGPYYSPAASMVPCLPAYSCNCLRFTLATSPAACWPLCLALATHTLFQAPGITLWLPMPSLGPHAMLWLPMTHFGCSPCALAAHTMLQPLASCSCHLPNTLATHSFTFVGSWPPNHPGSCCASTYAPRPPPYYFICSSPSCTQSWSAHCFLSFFPNRLPFSGL